MDPNNLSRNKISIAEYVKKVNDNFGRNRDILKAITEYGVDLSDKLSQALFPTAVDLAEEIHELLNSKEDLKLADKNDPKSTTPLALDRSKHKISPEILGWSIALLSVAWTGWVFTSKSNNPAYQNDPKYSNVADRNAASANVKIALPYIYNSIMDTLNKAQEIGECRETNYEPDFIKNPAEIELRGK